MFRRTCSASRSARTTADPCAGRTPRFLVDVPDRECSDGVVALAHRGTVARGRCDGSRPAAGPITEPRAVFLEGLLDRAAVLRAYSAVGRRTPRARAV